MASLYCTMIVYLVHYSSGATHELEELSGYPKTLPLRPWGRDPLVLVQALFTVKVSLFRNAVAPARISPERSRLMDQESRRGRGSPWAALTIKRHSSSLRNDNIAPPSMLRTRPTRSHGQCGINLGMPRRSHVRARTEKSQLGSVHYMVR
ncbi:hypothetical protein B0H11DRAFT_248911 [Mycena galericulata]|nr:hypothetical protein B0H11DRAFT_248911 [Mycena galericulata]